jgi:hypothetical protein
MHDKDARTRHTSQSAADMAARTFVRAELGWLRGIPTGPMTPTGLPWITRPRLMSAEKPTFLRVDRERLRASEFGRNTARRRFPKALPRLVGDVDVWSARTDTQFNVLKRVIHEGAAFPGLADLVRLSGLRRSVERGVLSRANAEPRLSEVLAALVWLHWHDEAAMLVAMAALPTRAVLAVLDRVDGPLSVALELVQLAADRAPVHLFNLIADPRAWDVPCPTWQMAQVISRFRLAGKRHQIDLRFVTGTSGWPPRQLGPQLIAYATSLQSIDAKIRKRQLSLLEVLLPITCFDPWQFWWSEVQAFERRGLRFQGQRRADLPPREEEALQQLNAERIRLETPTFDWGPLRWSINRVSRATTPASFDDLMQCLVWLSPTAGDVELARRFNASWASDGDRPTANAVGKVLAALRRIIKALPDATLEQRTRFVDGLARLFSSSWLENTHKQQLQLSRVVTVLLSLIVPPPDGAAPMSMADIPIDLGTLADALAIIDDPQVVARAVIAISSNVGRLYGRDWLTLLHIADNDPLVFAGLARAWPPNVMDYNELEELRRLVTDPAFAALVRGCVIQEQVPRLAGFVRLSRLCHTLRLSDATGPALPSADGAPPLWLGRYPAALHPVLTRIAAVDPRAIQAIDDILGDDFPSTEKVARERSALLDLAAAATGAKRLSLEKRIAKLDALSTTPVRVTPHRLANLASKLERRLLHARLLQAEQSTLDRLQTSLSDWFGVQPPIEWLQRRDVTEVLVGLAGLDKSFRTLGLRLLARSFNAKPVDLRDDVPNRTFLDGLVRRGLDIAPWLDGIAPLRIEVDGRAMIVSMDRDPLSVLCMGYYFDTCLSPGSSNFFSAITNAADINKAVVFVRDEAGVVQGRCLLGLTDAGRIIAFHVYAHAHAKALTADVRRHVEALASAIGTTIQPEGKVRSLLTTRWYDDGPNDLTGQLDFLLDGSAFRLALPTLQPDHMLDHVRQHQGPDVSSVVVFRISYCTEIEQRPELLLSLLPYLGDEHRLEQDWLSRLVGLVRRAGDADAALRLADVLARQVLDSQYSVYDYHVAAEYLALGRPQQALTFIRRTRRVPVRDWADETTERMLVGAQALEALGRPHRALEVARMAAQQDPAAHHMVRRLEARIAQAQG